jgi:hypothetical protein
MTLLLWFLGVPAALLSLIALVRTVWWRKVDYYEQIASCAISDVAGFESGASSEQLCMVALQIANGGFLSIRE